MKKLGTFLACLTFVLGLFVVNAHADYYSSWVEATTTHDHNEGETYALAQDNNLTVVLAHAEALAQGLSLEGWSYVSASAGILDNPRYANTLSTVTQSFKVTETGTASINFAWAGWLGLFGTSPTGTYSVGYSLNAEDDLYSGHFEDSGSIENYSDYIIVSDSDSLDYDFEESDLGNEFCVTFDLVTYANVDPISLSETEGLDMYSFFSMSGEDFGGFKITGFTGGLEVLGGSQVPLPGAFLLLGSGLLGLVGFARRRRTQ